MTSPENSCDNVNIMSKCGSCRKLFNREGNLDVDTESDSEFQCATCGEIFSRAAELDVHASDHPLDEGVLCEICSKLDRICKSVSKELVDMMGKKGAEEAGAVPFPRSSSAPRSSSQAGKKLSVCSLCGETFVEAKDLESHLIIHNIKESYNRKVEKSAKKPDGKGFTCDVCGKDFLHLSRLKVHKKTHTGEKRFKCEVCDKGFYFMSHKKKHTCGHTKERRDMTVKCVIRGSISSHTCRLICEHTQETSRMNVTCAANLLVFSVTFSDTREHILELNGTSVKYVAKKSQNIQDSKFTCVCILD